MMRMQVLPVQARAVPAQASVLAQAPAHGLSSQSAEQQTSSEGKEQYLSCLHLNIAQQTIGLFNSATLMACKAHMVSSCDADSARDATVPVYNLDNQEVGQYTLPHDIFAIDVRRDILHRVVRWQLAKRQQVQAKADVHLQPAVEFGLFCYPAALSSLLSSFSMSCHCSSTRQPYFVGYSQNKNTS